MLITNVSIQPTQQNFNGKLKIEGLKNFYPEKLAEIAQIFEIKTIGNPDAILKGECKSINGGKKYHYTTFAYNGKDFANILTVKFRTYFESRTPEQIANTFVRFVRIANKEKKKEVLHTRINQLKTSKDNYIKRIETHKQNGREDFVNVCKTRAAKLTRRIHRLEREYERISRIKKPPTGAKSWIYE